MLPDLTGTWRIYRRICGMDARFTGDLTFTTQDGGLLYRESGTLRLPASSHEAYRSYIYRPSGNALQILYDDGRPFLNLTFKNGIAGDVHACGPDTYRATFKIKNESEWVCAFAVTGPRKNYFAVSRMTRT